MLGVAAESACPTACRRLGLSAEVSLWTGLGCLTGEARTLSYSCTLAPLIWHGHVCDLCQEQPQRVPHTVCWLLAPSAEVLSWTGPESWTGKALVGLRRGCIWLCCIACSSFTSALVLCWIAVPSISGNLRTGHQAGDVLPIHTDSALLWKVGNATNDWCRQSGFRRLHCSAFTRTAVSGACETPWVP